MKFKITAEEGNARTGLLELNKGKIQTPAFMPVGTYGAVKSVTPERWLKLHLKLFLAIHFTLCCDQELRLLKSMADYMNL